LHQAEHCRCGADPERQREYGDHREPGLLPQLSPTQSNIVEHRQLLRLLTANCPLRLFAGGAISWS
jgi:hypothetical protein